MDKPKNREILKLHLKHKEEKLCKRIKDDADKSEKLAQEMEKLEKENQENFVFRLADMSFPASECDSKEYVAKELHLPTYEKFDYPVNESELAAFKRQLNEKSLEVIKREKLLLTSQNNANEDDKEIGVSCGQKVGNRLVLRNFHDRICDEPRGEANYHRSRGTGKSTCLTHEEWLNAIANDPEILVSEMKR